MLYVTRKLFIAMSALIVAGTLLLVGCEETGDPAQPQPPQNDPQQFEDQPRQQQQSPADEQPQNSTEDF
ncbi:MAG: hypothetical protein WDZ65_09910 [Aquisalimonadaceae bacterium]